MAKRGRPRAVVPTVTRKQLSKRQKEQRFQRWLTIGATIVLVSVVGVLGYGLYRQFVVLPAKPVATVNDVPIPLGAYQRLVRYRRFDIRNFLASLNAQLQQLDPTAEEQQFFRSYLQQQVEQVRNSLTTLPTAALDELIEDELIRQESAANNVVIAEAEIQLELERQFGYDRNPPLPAPTAITATALITITPEPTVAPMTEEEFTTAYSEYMKEAQKQTGITEQELRGLIQASLLRQRLEEFMGEQVPTQEEQLHCRHILVETEETANAVVQRLQGGEDFVALASEYSTDETNKNEGGDLGWFGRGAMVEEFEEAAFALQPGEVSDVVQTTFGYHIIECLERDENRELDPPTLDQRKREGFSNWLLEQKNSDAIKRYWSPNLVPPDEGS